MDYYAEIGEGYDELHGAEQDAKLSEFLAKVEIDPRSSLLDVGCGTGRSYFMLECHWTGVEPSKLRDHAKPEVVHRIKAAKGEELPFPDASFDVILSLTALQNFDDAKKGVVEIQRVLKPGGTIMISFLKKSPKASDLRMLLDDAFPEAQIWEQQHDVMCLAVHREILD